MVFSIVGLSRFTASVCNQLPSSALAHEEMLDMSNFVYFWVFLSVLRWYLTMSGSCGDVGEVCSSRETEPFGLPGGLVPSVTVTLTMLGIWRWSLEDSIWESAVPSPLRGLEKGRNRARRCDREEAFREIPVAELDVALVHLISYVPHKRLHGHYGQISRLYWLKLRGFCNKLAGSKASPKFEAWSS